MLAYSKFHPFQVLLIFARVLLLKPFIEFLNFRYRNGSVVQHKGIRISKVPLLVNSFLKPVVSFIRFQHYILENCMILSADLLVIQKI